MFGISMLYGVYRSSGICRMRIEHNYFFKAFYSFVVVHNIIRFFLFFMLFYIADTNYTKMTPSNQTFAKILFLSCNTPKFVQKLCSYSNLLVSLNISFRSRFDKFDILKYHPLTYKTWFRVCAWIIVFLLSALTLGCAAIFYLDIITLNQYIYCIAGTSLVTIGFYFLLEVYKNIKFTGHPFINQDSRKRNKLVKSIAQFMILGECVDLSIYFFLIVSIQFLSDSIDSILTDQSWSSIAFYLVYLGEMFFNEFLVVFFATN